MKGIIRYLQDTWWVFLAAALIVLGMTYFTGWLLCLAFLPVLAIMACYMGSVRYDTQGKERFPQPKSIRQNSR